MGAGYRNLPDRTLRGESVFVAEGLLLTQRLLESSHETESVFVTDDYAEEFLRRVPAGVPVYVAAEKLLLEVVGFNFHRGALALGLAACQRQVTIPVTSAVDSLNLGVAAGIFLHEMTHPRQGRKSVGEAAK